MLSQIRTLVQSKLFVEMVLSLVAVTGSAQYFVPIGQPVIARASSYTATLLPNGRVLIAGGWAPDGSAIREAELYDPLTGHFMLTGGMTQARASHVATLLPDGRVLVAGGEYQTPAAYVRLTSVETYDPLSGTFQTTGQTILPHEGTAVAFAIGKVLFWGGAYETPEIYDYVSNISRTLTPQLFVSGSAVTPLANGSVLLTGGLIGSGEPSKQTKLFDSTTESISDSIPLDTGFANHFAVQLKNGSILLGGGIALVFEATTRCTSTAMLYDAQTGTSNPTTGMNFVRCTPTATVLSDGRILVTGGAPSAEIYDPDRGVFTTINDMLSASQRTATLLPSGDVLVIGADGAELLVPQSRCAPVPLLCPASVAGDLTSTCMTLIGLPPDQRPELSNQYTITSTAGDTLHVRAASNSGTFLRIAMLDDSPYVQEITSSVDSLDFPVMTTASYILQVEGQPTSYTMSVTGCNTPAECTLGAPVALSAYDAHNNAATCGAAGVQTLLGNTIRLWWSPIMSAAGYAYEIVAVPNAFPSLAFTVASGTSSGLTALATVLPQLPMSAYSYYWRVRAYSQESAPFVSCQWSPPCSFDMVVAGRREAVRH